MRIIKLNDDEWSHSSDDGSGYSNEGHFQNKKNMNESKIIDYVLGLFTKNEMSKDDIHWAINEKFDYDNEPLLILNRLISEGLILEMGEAYYCLTSEGRKAKNGYGKYVRNRKFWQYIDKANKVSTLVKFLYGAGGFIAGWLAKTLANVLGM